MSQPISVQDSVFSSKQLWRIIWPNGFFSLSLQTEYNPLKNVMAKTVLYDVDNARLDSEAEIIDKT